MVWKKKGMSDPLKYASLLMRYRPRSEREMRERLSRKFSEEEVERTIETLKEKGILDDERFALMMAKNELEVKFHGPRMIKSKLIKLGVSEDVIERALEKAMRDFNVRSKMEELRKKFEDFRKLREYLYRRGFDPEILENESFDE